MTALLEHVSAATGHEVTDLSLRQARAQFERAYLIGLLTLHRGNVCRAFEASGMGDRSSFYRKMRAVGITTGEIMRIRREAKSEIVQERR